MNILGMRKKGSFFISFILLLLSYHNLNAEFGSSIIEPLIPNAVQDIYVPSPYENQRIGGILGLRMEINLEKRLLEIDQETMLSGFRSRPGKQDWIGEHVGKYLETACNTWQYSHN